MDKRVRTEHYEDESKQDASNYGNDFHVMECGLVEAK
jgi:hypothetical protein